MFYLKKTNEADNIKMAILTQIAPLTNFLHNVIFLY